VYELDVVSQLQGSSDLAATPVVRKHSVRKRYRELHALHCHVRASLLLDYGHVDYRLKMLITYLWPWLR
jgi:hypothetical protein